MDSPIKCPNCSSTDYSLNPCDDSDYICKECGSWFDKRYSIVYADPPWHFGSKQLQKYDNSRFSPLSNEYPTMTTDDICSLPIAGITNKDCALFLWATDAHIPDALRVIEAWGFKYVTVAFIWSKKTETWKQVATLGAWTMKNCELCLLAIKGQMLKYKQSNNVYQLVEAIRTEHSTKPQEVRDRIVRLFGDLPKLELFARRKVESWDCWGNEVEGAITIRALSKKFKESVPPCK